MLATRPYRNGIRSRRPEAIRLRIDPQNRVIAATDFRHALQAEEETVADYVRRLFQIAYGGDGVSSQTKDTMLLHGYDLMRSPTVSGPTRSSV